MRQRVDMHQLTIRRQVDSSLSQLLNFSFLFRGCQAVPRSINPRRASFLTNVGSWSLKPWAWRSPPSLSTWNDKKNTPHDSLVSFHRLLHKKANTTVQHFNQKKGRAKDQIAKLERESEREVKKLWLRSMTLTATLRTNHAHPLLRIKGHMCDFSNPQHPHAFKLNESNTNLSIRTGHL